MQLGKLLQTKTEVIGYIGATGQSFLVKPFSPGLSMAQRLDILIDENPQLTIDTIEILYDKLEVNK